MFEKRLWYAVEMVINDYDIMELLSIGAPSDEYHPEIRKIVDYILAAIESDTLTYRTLSKEIKEIFEKMFSRSPDENVCDAVAMSILITIFKIL